MGQYRKALEFHDRARELARDVGDRNVEGNVLIATGNVYTSLGESHRALECYYQALSPLHAAKGTGGEAGAFNNLMFAWGALGNPSLAIFYGKQAVNDYQQLRGRIRGLEKETQKSFLGTVEASYRYLAGLLIAENRLEEATQMINLLRDQEFFDFNGDTSQSAGQIVLTPHESATLPALQAALEKVASVELQLAYLKRSQGDRQPTSAEALTLKRLIAESDKTSADFQTTLKNIEADFSQASHGAASANDKVESVQDVKYIQAALHELGDSAKQEVAALYTLIGEDKFYIILIRPGGELRSFEYPIKAVDLNMKILQVYSLLQSPKYDPRPLCKELYNIVFKPAEAELKKAGVQTLMWQLDGSLRYLPVAALFDGEKYLVERFQNTVFTRANKDRMTRAVTSRWTGTGFGSSHAHAVDLFGDGTKINFFALPGVTAELASIFRTRQTVGRTRGILNGDVFTDARFTKNTFYGAVKRRRPLIHISSHFSFRPGDEARSFLLLGDGTALPLNELKKHVRLFEGVELLTLSACNTALQKANDDGREIDGFAEQAQRLGADAIMATLWSVSDNSTPYLMRDFYLLRLQQAGRSKAAALRLAQLALLNGTARVEPFFDTTLIEKGTSEAALQLVIVPTDSQRDAIPSRDTADTIYVNQDDAPLYTRDAAKPYAHPYYWAPFVLFGNWR